MSGRRQGFKYRTSSRKPSGGSSLPRFSLKGVRSGGVASRMSRNLSPAKVVVKGVSKFKLNDPYWTKKIGAAQASGMRLQGAYIRRQARQLIRFRATKDLYSKAGSPPFSHSRNPVASIRNIQYDYDPTTMAMWVGAVFLKRTYTQGTVPFVHERGPVTVTQKLSVVANADGSVPKWVRDSRVAKNPRATPKQAKAYKRLIASGKVKRISITRTVRYPARKFMSKALNQLRSNGDLEKAFIRGFHNSFAYSGFKRGKLRGL